MGFVQKNQIFPGILLAIGVMLNSSSASAEPVFDRGQALYENHCRQCHESWAHTREKRRAKSIEDLRQWARAWSMHAKLEWTNTEVDDVANYLDQEFYHLTEKP